jgi:hypothetical protein
MDIPSRLSDQQKFILAFLSTRDSYSVRGLSRKTAEEVGDRTIDRQEKAQQAGQNILPDADSPQVVSTIIKSIFSGLKEQHAITNSHSASFSRALTRLDERGLIQVGRRTVTSSERQYDDDGHAAVWETHEPSATRARLWLTDEGQAAGAELYRRSQDGRYNLDFQTSF